MSEGEMFTDAEIASLKGEAKIAALQAKVIALRRLATDRYYFMEAYRNMLGPTGLIVARMWDEKRVKRIHVSWVLKASEMTGEERAQHILDWEAAPRSIIENIDGD